MNPEMSAGVAPLLRSSAQSPGTPPLDSTSLNFTSSGAGVPGEQTTVAVRLSVQSPSLTVSVTVAVPGAAQVSVAAADVALASIPVVAIHAYVSGPGALSRSCAVPDSVAVPPTTTSPGLTLIASTTGQTLSVPLMIADPVRAASRHSTWTVTDTVMRARTVNVA